MSLFRTAARSLVAGILLVLLMYQAAMAQPEAPHIGIVLMHGKGASASSLEGLATPLAAKGLLVANLSMPWSAGRSYDVDTTAAMHEVEAALDGLRARGATRLFVAGHSQGGVFALSYGVRHAVDGIVAIAPGGNVGNEVFKDKLGDSLERARKLVAEGKGDERPGPGVLLDIDPGSGRSGYSVNTTPAIYLSWFDPQGAMNEFGAVKRMNPATPVLFIAPTGDVPGLRQANPRIFALLPRNPHTRFYEPGATHTGAPQASAEEIARWTMEVAADK